MTRRTRRSVLAAVVTAAVGLNVERGETHKPITSKYTYNEDVFPIVRERCGRCHVPDGVAPMSLMTYQEAYPWGESVRAEIIAKHMPPWHAEDSAVRFKNQPTMTSTETDKILVWVSGGYPQGNPKNMPPHVALQNDWPIGKPDLALPLTEITLDPDTNETIKEFTVATGSTETNWVRAVDLLPGTPAIIRDATVSIKRQPTSGASHVAEADVLAAWVPGEDPVDAEGGAFRLPPQAELTVRVHYRKTFNYSGREMKDRSTVGLYFAPGPTNEIKELIVGSGPIKTAGSPVSFITAVDEDLRALAFRPAPSLSNVGLQVDTVTPAGVRTPLIRLAVRPNWARRYWFDPPLALPKGTRIEVRAAIDGADTLLPPAGTPLPPQQLDGTPLRVMFDVVASGSTPRVE
jgi:hypothetical protein